MIPKRLLKFPRKKRKKLKYNRGKRWEGREGAQWAKIANFGEAEVGTTVLLAIPDVDKGRCELPNLKCVVFEKTGGGMYR